MAKKELDLTAIDFYNNTASDFDSRLNQPFYEGIAGRLMDLIPTQPVKSILEVGAGCGFATRKMRERFPKAKIVALEPAGAMLFRARSRVPEATWICQSLFEFNPSCRFDLVFTSMSYHWLSAEERQKLLDLARSVALAIPVTSQNFSSKSVPNKAEGNQLLTKLMLSLKAKSRWARDVRRGSQVAREVNKHFSRMVETDLSLRERFITYQSLVRALYSRGVLLALYDGQVELAKKILTQSPERGEAVFDWNIKFVVGYG